MGVSMASFKVDLDHRMAVLDANSTQYVETKIVSQYYLYPYTGLRSINNTYDDEVGFSSGKDYNTFDEQLWPKIFFPIVICVPCVSFILLVGGLSGAFQDQCVTGNGALRVHIDSIHLTSEPTDSSWFNTHDEIQVKMGSGVTTAAPICQYTMEEDEHYSMGEGDRILPHGVEVNSFYDWPITVQLVEKDSGLTGEDDTSKRYTLSSNQLARMRYAIHHGYVKKYKISRTFLVRGGNIFTENSFLGLISSLLCISVFDFVPVKALKTSILSSLNAQSIVKRYEYVHGVIDSVDKYVSYGMIFMELITGGCDASCFFEALFQKERFSTFDALLPYALDNEEFESLFDVYMDTASMVAKISDGLEVCLEDFAGANDATYQVQMHVVAAEVRKKSKVQKCDFSSFYGTYDICQPGDIEVSCHTMKRKIEYLNLKAYELDGVRAGGNMCEYSSAEYHTFPLADDDSDHYQRLCCEPAVVESGDETYANTTIESYLSTSATRFPDAYSDNMNDFIILSGEMDGGYIDGVDVPAQFCRLYGGTRTTTEQDYLFYIFDDGYTKMMFANFYMTDDNHYVYAIARSTGYTTGDYTRSCASANNAWTIKTDGRIATSSTQAGYGLKNIVASYEI